MAENMKITKAEELKEIRKVIFNDDSEYVAGKGSNGGCYSFWEKYENLGNGIFRKSYHTSADFDYCPICGIFGCTWCEEEDYETVTEEELFCMIDKFEENDVYYINIVK